jgi:hypothetical protein
MRLPPPVQRSLLAFAGALVAFAVAFVGGLSARPAEPADAHHVCRLSGARTVLGNRNARMVTRAATVRPRYRVTRYYGCRYRTNRFFRLADVGEPGLFSDRVEPRRLAGVFAGFAGAYQEPAGEQHLAYVRAVDLRSGRARVREQALPDAGPSESYRVTDLELRYTGGLAWIVERRSSVEGPGSPVVSYEVHKVDRGGPQRLDAGADVDPASLTLSGATISWRRGGLTRTAVLGSAASG